MIILDDDHPFSQLSEYCGFMRTLVSGEDYAGLDGSGYQSKAAAYWAAVDLKC